ncbi:alpha/beta hydrolase family protein [Jiangella gansuensis]|uniref:alpha/beta hydrolase family protein n=1 Tax=Jiangella gansuensis TaxID=281473 RepID=UPI00047D4DF9|nr:prolyl oligopeptidase family serine peptidase [Jiangella gansuensis]
MTSLSRRTVLKSTAASVLAVGAAGKHVDKPGRHVDKPGRGRTPHGPTSYPIDYRTTPGGVPFGLWGTIPTSPAPTLIILSGTIDQAFSASFLEAGAILADPPTNYLCVSIDLPCHGAHDYPDARDGLRGWADLAVAQHDFVADFNARLSEVVDHLVDEELTDENKIAVSGTSRGGFLALRYAAFDPRMTCGVGYAPVTDLRQLTEFGIAESVQFVDQLSLEAHVDPLVGRPVFVVIGDRDVRVGTDSVIHFARTLSAKAVGSPAPDVLNPSFEDVDNGWPLWWTLDPLPKTQTAAPSTAQARTGTYSLRVENVSGTSVGVRTSKLPAEPGADYTATMWVLTESGTPATMFLEFFNASGSRIHYQFVAPAASGGWQEVSVDAAAPAEATTLDVLIYGAVSAVGASYHDDVSVTKNSGTPVSPSVPSEVALHVLSEPRGHTTPDAGAGLAATWIERVVNGT